MGLRCRGSPLQCLRALYSRLAWGAITAPFVIQSGSWLGGMDTDSAESGCSAPHLGLTLSALSVRTGLSML